MMYPSIGQRTQAVIHELLRDYAELCSLPKESIDHLLFRGTIKEHVEADAFLLGFGEYVYWWLKDNR
jgi:hypothetical protein